MELHVDKKPILLVAGVDDMQMVSIWMKCIKVVKLTHDIHTSTVKKKIGITPPRLLLQFQGFN
jgi:hypothetical protein